MEFHLHADDTAISCAFQPSGSKAVYSQLRILTDEFLSFNASCSAAGKKKKRFTLKLGFFILESKSSQDPFSRRLSQKVGSELNLNRHVLLPSHELEKGPKLSETLKKIFNDLFQMVVRLPKYLLFCLLSVF